MRIIDTHLHLIDQDKLRYPWLDDTRALNRCFSLAEYLAQATPAGIEAALHMEVDVADADRDAETDFVLGLGQPVVGAIASCRPEADDFPAYLDRVAARPGVKGLRRILHTSADELGERPVFTENLRRLAAHDLSFDLCVLARQLPIAQRLVRACPGVRFILDHCGVPDVKAKALDPWRAEIRAMAALPNIVCKISGVVAYAATDWTVDDLRPFVEHCIESFGWDRVVWGSDWPVCTLTADLAGWVAAARTIVAGASPDEQQRLFSRNAARVYRIETAAGAA